jgi:hypothetical protein
VSEIFDIREWVPSAHFSGLLILKTSKARDRGRAVRFLIANALNLRSLREQFDTVFDCGLFHLAIKTDLRLWKPRGGGTSGRPLFHALF